MVVHGVFEIATKSSDVALKQKISSSNVWKEAWRFVTSPSALILISFSNLSLCIISLLNELVTHLGKRMSHPQLQAKYDNFIALLQVHLVSNSLYTVKLIWDSQVTTLHRASCRVPPAQEARERCQTPLPRSDTYHGVSMPHFGRIFHE